MSKLKVVAIGHLGRDCSVKHLDGGSCAINFSIACTERYKDKTGTPHEKTTWLDCVLWRKPESLKIADYLKKGQLVSIEGKPDVRAWLSKEGGEPRAAIQVRVDELILLGSKGNSEQPNSAEETKSDVSMNDSAETFTATTQEDDLPF